MRLTGGKVFCPTERRGPGNQSLLRQLLSIVQDGTNWQLFSLQLDPVSSEPLADNRLSNCDVYTTASPGSSEGGDGQSRYLSKVSCHYDIEIDH